MSITSMLFLFVFLPVSLAIFYITNDKAKEYVLVVISVVFYALGSIEYMYLFLTAILLTVLLGRGIHYYENVVTRKIFLITGILINLGILGYYKYTDFALITYGNLTSTEVQLKGLILPLGISFFTFKAISYLVDIYKGVAKLEISPIHDALYLSFFAQIQSGPLSRYNETKLLNDKAFQIDLFSDGVQRFVIGFSKKVLIANVLANITTEVFETPFENFSLAYAWLGAICYSLQLFFDFAGYSDMAIGLSAMFGFHCKENFNYPYMTESVTKFWRRWHISLSEWFRDYIYIPLGGSRTEKKWRVYFNLLIVWLLTGIWHGASWNFVVWGLGYFVAIAFERITNLPGKLKTKTGKIVYRVLTLIFINFQWVLFNSTDLISGIRFLKRMFVCKTNELADLRTLFLIKDYGFFILIAILFSFPIVPVLNEKLNKHQFVYVIYEVVKTLIIAFSFIWAISFVVAGQNNPFTYANF